MRELYYEIMNLLELSMNDIDECCNMVKYIFLYKIYIHIECLYFFQCMGKKQTGTVHADFMQSRISYECFYKIMERIRRSGEDEEKYMRWLMDEYIKDILGEYMKEQYISPWITG